MPPRRAFTLIELLVVIAIIAILAVVVVLTLNPAQLLAESRDANRVSDMATLNSAINLYSTDQSGASTYSLGTASTSYISLPSPSSSCATLGLATSAYSYSCSTSANYRIASSSGWLPINFNLISSGAPFGSVPVDPVNQTSSNLYYSYETNDTVFALSAFFESSKYAKTMETSGGDDPALEQAGSGDSILPDAGRGLVGYWPLNEGTGSSAIDWSGEGGNGAWTGSASGTSGYYSAGHVWQWAGYFNGTNDYVTLPSLGLTGSNNITMCAWINFTTLSANDFVQIGSQSGGRAVSLDYNGQLNVVTYGGGTRLSATSAPSTNTWYDVCAVLTGGTSATLYVNGSVAASGGFNYSGLTGSGGYFIGTFGTGGYTNGYVNDVRIYDRALSAAEVQEIYNAEK